MMTKENRDGVGKRIINAIAARKNFPIAIIAPVVFRSVKNVFRRIYGGSVMDLPGSVLIASGSE